MKRREFVWWLFNVIAWPLAARAQETLSPVRRVGLLMPYSETDIEYRAYVRALWEELEKLGWTRGANVEFDERWTTDDMDRVRTNAASLMASRPDVVVAAGGRVIPV